MRKACAEGIVAAELLAAQRTSYAAAVADAAKRGITPGLTPIRSNPRTTKRDGNEKEVRYAATDAVRRCETAVQTNAGECANRTRAITDGNDER